jgi:RNA polymerase sigma-70 factor (ECF subfamily)
VLTTSLTLLERLRKNADGAWDRFVRLYQPLLLVWARRQGLQEADALELTQEVLVKLLLLLPTYQRGEGQSFRGWLYRVTTNQCVDFRRRRRAILPLPPAEDLAASDPPSVVELEEAEYRRLLVHRTLELIRGDFNEPTWAAFLGVRVEGRPAREVAGQLGLSANAVYLACHRVLTRIKEELAGLLD